MVLLVDFDDSFTFNIWAELERQFGRVKVLHYSELIGLNPTKFKLIVLGPGPGSPFDYKDVLSYTKAHLNQVKWSGICLGHQILGVAQGGTIKKSIRPAHGQKTTLALPEWLSDTKKTCMVQRYNSLTVEGVCGEITRDCDGEIQVLKTKNSISYQFHPESVGTSYPKLFFRPLVQL